MDGDRARGRRYRLVLRGELSDRLGTLFGGMQLERAREVGAPAAGTVPGRAGLVLISLILVESVANMNLAARQEPPALPRVRSPRGGHNARLHASPCAWPGPGGLRALRPQTAPTKAAPGQKRSAPHGLMQTSSFP